MKLSIGKDLNKVREDAKQKLVGDGSYLVHMRKRFEAEQVRAGRESPYLSEEAAIRGIGLTELVDLILSKPDELMLGELERQRKIQAINRATSAFEIEALVSESPGTV